MAYNRHYFTLEKDLATAWQGIVRAVAKMHPAAMIRPTSAADIFKLAGDSDRLKVLVGPVTFKIPERANHSVSTLYVVLRGWISFGDVLDGMRTTYDFGTQVGYFRQREACLDHIYGIHYDMDEDLPGHPVFHAQMCSQAAMFSSVATQFGVMQETYVDYAEGLLRNVRVPTAQMDAFAVITQIGADHLVSSVSDSAVLDQFKKLRQACDFFRGSGCRLPYLNDYPATHCYRSTHWYERTTGEDRLFSRARRGGFRPRLCCVNSGSRIASLRLRCRASD